MTTDPQKDVTVLLRRWQDGDNAAFELLLEHLYDDIRSIAQRQFRKERQGHTLQPTAVAHEAWLRLAHERLPARDRGHFLALTTKVIRRVLVDHSRERNRDKRGGELLRVDLVDDLLPNPDQQANFLALHAALEQLADVDVVAAEIVELRYIGGMTIPEIAGVIEISEATVSRKWSFARAWLRAQLAGVS